MTDGALVEVDDGSVVWRFDRAFLTSGWACIWGRGCQGIHETARPELMDGCCSLGAELADDDDAANVLANAATLDAELWQHQAAAGSSPLERRGERWHTKVVDGGCIFLNRPGFAGGAGCALHLGARRWGESPTVWKPAVCWELPLKVDWVDEPDGRTIATVRAWTRADFGSDGDTIGWWCTDRHQAPEAFAGPGRVVDTLADELRGIVGDAVYERLRADLG